jgi:hypothetical protein
MEATRCSEMSVDFQRTARYYNQEVVQFITTTMKISTII